jgi:hypothetical protein
MERLNVAGGCCVELIAAACLTSPGGGSNLLWTIQIDGQVNRDPVANYGPPVIYSITYPSGGTVTAIRTDGDVEVVVNGYAPVNARSRHRISTWIVHAAIRRHCFDCDT